MNIENLNFIYNSLESKTLNVGATTLLYLLNNPNKPKEKLPPIAESFLLHLNCIKSSMVNQQYTYANYSMMDKKNILIQPFPFQYIETPIKYAINKTLNAIKTTLQNKQTERYEFHEMRKYLQKTDFQKNNIVKITNKLHLLADMINYSTQDSMYVYSDPDTQFNTLRMADCSEIKRSRFE